MKYKYNTYIIVFSILLYLMMIFKTKTGHKYTQAIYNIPCKVFCENLSIGKWILIIKLLSLFKILNNSKH